MLMTIGAPTLMIESQQLVIAFILAEILLLGVQENSLWYLARPLNSNTEVLPMAPLNWFGYSTLSLMNDEFLFLEFPLSLSELTTLVLYRLLRISSCILEPSTWNWTCILFVTHQASFHSIFQAFTIALKSLLLRALELREHDKDDT